MESALSSGGVSALEADEFEVPELPFVANVVMFLILMSPMVSAVMLERKTRGAFQLFAKSACRQL